MSDKNPQVIIIAGPNGAGKTTLAPFLLRDELGILEYVNADPIAQGLSGFAPASVGFEAGRIMLTRLKELANEKRTFAFETTLAGKSYVRWLNSLREQRYVVQLMFVWLRTAELAIQRVRARVRFGGHAVDEDVIRRRHAAGLRNFWQVYQPLADTWAVYDNSGSDPVFVGKGTLRNPVPSYYRTDLWRVFCETRD
jgi:predicted ABC-type ATPase